MKISKIDVWRTNRNFTPIEWVIDIYEEGNEKEILKLFSVSKPIIQIEAKP